MDRPTGTSETPTRIRVLALVAMLAAACMAGCGGGSSGPNNAPTMDSLSLTPQAPTTITDIVVQAQGSDPDGDQITYQYAWSVNGVAVAGETGDTLGMIHFARGDVVRCSVTATDGLATSAATEQQVTVVNAVGMWSAEIQPGSPQYNCAVTGTDPDGDAVMMAFQWSGYSGAMPLRTGIVIPTCDGTSQTLDELCLLPGDMLECQVILDDGFDQVMIQAPTFTVPNP